MSRLFHARISSNHSSSEHHLHYLLSHCKSSNSWWECLSFPCLHCSAQRRYFHFFLNSKVTSDSKYYEDTRALEHKLGKGYEVLVNDDPPIQSFQPGCQTWMCHINARSYWRLYSSFHVYPSRTQQPRENILIFDGLLNAVSFLLSYIFNRISVKALNTLSGEGHSEDTICNISNVQVVVVCY